MRCFPPFGWFLVLLLPCVSSFVLAAEPPANFVVNPGFESGIAPWMARGSGNLLLSTPAHTGASAALITNRAEASSGVAQSLLGALRPGASYFCAAWVRAESGGALRLNFEQRDGAGTNFITVANATVTNNAWTFLSGAFTLNVSGTLEDIIVYIDGPAAGVDLRVDNVAVVPLSGFHFVPGARAMI